MSGFLFSTRRLVTEFHNGYIKMTRKRPILPEILTLMRDQGLLSETPLPIPSITMQMSDEEFQKAYEEIPFEANRIIDGYLAGKPVTEANIFPKDRDVFCVQHFHNFGEDRNTTDTFFSVTYVFRGKCDFHFQKTHRELQEGDLCIIVPESEYLINPHTETFAFEGIIRVSSFNLMFGELITVNSVFSEFFRIALQKSHKDNYLLIHTDPEDSALRNFLKAFTAECTHDDTYANTSAISLMKLFLINSFRKYGNSAIMFSQDSGLRPDARTILEYIQNNYKEITLSKTAEYFHYNPSYISRMIHIYAHRSFTEIVTDLKISRAKEYLKQSNYRISDIAALVGYDSADHFSRAFKKQTGIAPAFYRSRYRREHRL
ncbi:MAG: helix-turn-helix transcriptional regulator [Parasporobacterium sp.]|nr:helix-turn-helix transcriptional regulator [Parasporobacterium sp.]